MKFFISSIVCFIIVGCSSLSKSPKDSFLWLENIEGDIALKWVKEQNEITKKKYETKSQFSKVKADVSYILGADDRIFYVSMSGDYVYHYLQTPKNPKGIFRKATFSSYAAKKPKWEEIINIDDLAKNENENWVWKGLSCFEPEYKRCLLKLSRGGKDAVVVREFDLTEKTFVQDGFVVPEAKTDVSWIDMDHVLLATSFGSDTLTLSGYPRQVRMWTRGQKYKDAKLITEANVDYVSASFQVFYHPKKPLSVIQKSPSFYETEYFINNNDNQLVRLDVPNDIFLWGLVEDQIIFETKSNWDRFNVKAGSLIAIPRSDLEKSGAVTDLNIIFTPNDKQSITDLKTTSKALYISLLTSVRGEIVKWTYKNKKWKSSVFALPKTGMTRIVSVDEKEDKSLVEYTDFLTPPQIWLFRKSGVKTKVAELPSRFQTKGLVVEQKFAISRDGTRIPYSVVRNTAKKGPRPTLLYGYGGFEISLTPSYLAVKGKTWVENGGTYVVANLRGGGEFGPNWHTSVLKHNRQKVFDDFIAVAEALIKEGITTSKQLGIEGYSNGGLLVGAVAMQRPDLFGAVICGAPLLDMMRFHKLLAGASWIGEYGDPDSPEDASYIKKYSPYQNIREKTKYPSIFIITSTKDDRVHPGHARKMAAKLLEVGAPLT
ncbi:MAG: S9 family peptidase, partial [Bdellovibrionales bacterium]|nr:S9 family peptidase [Bdellovibrionales bacterium]